MTKGTLKLVITLFGVCTFTMNKAQIGAGWIEITKREEHKQKNQLENFKSPSGDNTPFNWPVSATFIDKDGGINEIKDYLDYLIQSFGNPNIGANILIIYIVYKQFTDKIPAVDWFKGELKDFMLKQMSSKEFSESIYFDGEQLLADFDSFLKNDKPNWNEAWKFWPPVHLTWWLINNKVIYE